MVPSPYDDGWQMSREPYSVSCHFTDSSEWTGNRWVFERLHWCEENGIRLAGLDEQTYILSEEGEEYKPIRGKRITCFEFRFMTPKDAIMFKLVWAGN